MSYKPGSGKRTGRILLFLSMLVFGLFSGQLETQAEGQAEPIQIMFFGDSLPAGYGLDPSQAYPALIQKKIDKAGLPAKVRVGAVSGDTSAGGLRRIDWMLRQPVDVFVLALGANDGLRGVDPAATRENLAKILERVLAKYPDAALVVAGMRLPPSLGESHVESFKAIYPALAEAHRATLIPDLLKGVGGVVALNLSDRIHPNAKGHKILADTVWTGIKPILTGAIEADGP